MNSFKLENIFTLENLTCNDQGWVFQSPIKSIKRNKEESEIRKSPNDNVVFNRKWVIPT